jgi:hypothetical protein
MIGKRQDFTGVAAALREGAKASCSLLGISDVEQSSSKTHYGVCKAWLTVQLIKSALNLLLTFHVRRQRLNAKLAVDALKF